MAKEEAKLHLLRKQGRKASRGLCLGVQCQGHYSETQHLIETEDPICRSEMIAGAFTLDATSSRDVCAAEKDFNFSLYHCQTWNGPLPPPDYKDSCTCETQVWLSLSSALVAKGLSLQSTP
jgi:hypothetical protein